MNAAGFAEHVASGPSIEPVVGEIILAADQLELLRRHYEMQEALLGTDRAIALGYAIEIGGNAKAHAPAVTAAGHGAHPTPRRRLQIIRAAPDRALARRGRGD